MLTIPRFRWFLLSAPLLFLGCHTVHVGDHDSDGGAAPDEEKGEPCGSVTCDPGLVCCNPTCGICTPPEYACPAVVCETTCAVNSDCRADEYCLTPEGSCPDQAAPNGTCVPRPVTCTDVRQEICGCDGSTYANRCEAAAQGVVVAADGACSSGGRCEAQDARGEGLCEAFFGFRWNGRRCEIMGGCNCSGPDCAQTYGVDEELACEMDHAGCASCDAQDARGEGACRAQVGVIWDGAACVTAYGCRCVGSDCDELYNDRDTCKAAHAHCAPGRSSCAAMDVQEIGGCEPHRGYAWDGIQCEPIAGCQCAGADCERLYPDLAACQIAHEGCDRPAGGQCAGFLGQVCRPDEWCDFEASHTLCGGDDAQGTCRPRPTECELIHAPVCACDRRVYENACEAHAAGWDDLGPASDCDAL